MGSRSSRADRRAPLRRPVPVVRQVTRRQAPPGDLTEASLVRGWPAGPGVRIRQASAADLDAVAGLLAGAGMALDDRVAASVTDATAGAALRAGLRAWPRPGRAACAAHLAERLVGPETGAPAAPFLHAALVLVAEQAAAEAVEAAGVVGAVVAYPPVGVLAERVGACGDQQAGLLLLAAGVTGLVQVRAVAVAEPSRRRGVGTALLARCTQVYRHCGYGIGYAQAAPDPAVAACFTGAGFTALPPGDGFDPAPVLDGAAPVLPDPGRQILLWRAGVTRRR